MKSLFLLPLLVLLCFCKSSKPPLIQISPDSTNPASINQVAADLKTKIKPETITLIAESAPDDHVFAYYEDESQDQHNLFLKKDSVSEKYAPVTVKSKQAIWVRFAKGMAQRIIFKDKLLLPLSTFDTVHLSPIDGPKSLSFNPDSSMRTLM